MTKKDLAVYLVGLAMVVIIATYFEYRTAGDFIRINWWTVLITCIFYIICMFWLHFHGPFKRGGKK